MNTLIKKTILLVEDEAIIAMLTAETLKDFDYEVVIAGTGEKAIDIALNSENINLILMDIDLGKSIDGPQAAQQILAKRKIPIVFLTSHSGKEYVDKVKQITRYGYIIKNSNDFVLQSSIEMAFQLFEAHTNLESRMDALRKSEQRFRGYIENASDIVYELTTEGIITYLSPNWLYLMGQAATTALGKPFDLFIHPDDVHLCHEFLERIRNLDGRLISVDYRALHKNGSIRWHSCRGSMLYDWEGKVFGIMGIARDVTEQKRAEVELQKKIEELQRFHNLTVDRELTMIELKKEVNALLIESGKEAKYRIVN